MGCSKCEHDTWQNFEEKVIILCWNRVPSTKVEFTNSHWYLILGRWYEPIDLPIHKYKINYLKSGVLSPKVDEAKWPPPTLWNHANGFVRYKLEHIINR